MRSLPICVIVASIVSALAEVCACQASIRRPPPNEPRRHRDDIRRRPGLSHSHNVAHARALTLNFIQPLPQHRHRRLLPLNNELPRLLGLRFLLRFDLGHLERVETTRCRSSSRSKSNSQSARPISRHMYPLLVCSAHRQTIADAVTDAHNWTMHLRANSPALRRQVRIASSVSQ